MQKFFIGIMHKLQSIFKKTPSDHSLQQSQYSLYKHVQDIEKKCGGVYTKQYGKNRFEVLLNGYYGYGDLMYRFIDYKFDAKYIKKLVKFVNSRKISFDQYCGIIIPMYSTIYNNIKQENNGAFDLDSLNKHIDYVMSKRDGNSYKCECRDISNIVITFEVTEVSLSSSAPFSSNQSYGIKLLDINTPKYSMSIKKYGNRIFHSLLRLPVQSETIIFVIITLLIFGIYNYNSIVEFFKLHNSMIMVLELNPSNQPITNAITIEYLKPFRLLCIMLLPVGLYILCRGIYKLRKFIQFIIDMQINNKYNNHVRYNGYKKDDNLTILESTEKALTNYTGDAFGYALFAGDVYFNQIHNKFMHDINQIIIINAKKGMGKSTLINFIINHINNYDLRGVNYCRQFMDIIFDKQIKVVQFSMMQFIHSLPQIPSELMDKLSLNERIDLINQKNEVVIRVLQYIATQLEGDGERFLKAATKKIEKVNIAGITFSQFNSIFDHSLSTLRTKIKNSSKRYLIIIEDLDRLNKQLLDCVVSVLWFIHEIPLTITLLPCKEDVLKHAIKLPNETNNYQENETYKLLQGTIEITKKVYKVLAYDMLMRLGYYKDGKIIEVNSLYGDIFKLLNEPCYSYVEIAEEARFYGPLKPGIYKAMAGNKFKYYQILNSLTCNKIELVLRDGISKLETNNNLLTITALCYTFNNFHVDNKLHLDQLSNTASTNDALKLLMNKLSKEYNELNDTVKNLSDNRILSDKFLKLATQDNAWQTHLIGIGRINEPGMTPWDILNALNLPKIVQQRAYASMPPMNLQKSIQEDVYLILDKYSVSIREYKWIFKQQISRLFTTQHLIFYILKYRYANDENISEYLRTYNPHDMEVNYPENPQDISTRFNGIDDNDAKNLINDLEQYPSATMLKNGYNVRSYIAHHYGFSSPIFKDGRLIHPDENILNLFYREVCRLWGALPNNGSIIVFMELSLDWRSYNNDDIWNKQFKDLTDIFVLTLNQLHGFYILNYDVQNLVYDKYNILYLQNLGILYLRMLVNYSNSNKSYDTNISLALMGYHSHKASDDNGLGGFSKSIMSLLPSETLDFKIRDVIADKDCIITISDMRPYLIKLFSISCETFELDETTENKTLTMNLEMLSNMKPFDKDFIDKIFKIGAGASLS